LRQKGVFTHIKIVQREDQLRKKEVWKGTAPVAALFQGREDDHPKVTQRTVREKKASISQPQRVERIEGEGTLFAGPKPNVSNPMRKNIQKTKASKRRDKKISSQGAWKTLEVGWEPAPVFFLSSTCGKKILL